jgi:23S rRNA pseudouridine2457 synthase
MSRVIHQHFIIHKPYGYLSQFVHNMSKRKNKKLLGELGDFPEQTMAIGRLDENSEGLLLLTTDGSVSEYIRSSSIEKEYHVEVAGIPTDQAIKILQEGVLLTIEGVPYTTKPCQAIRLKTLPTFETPLRKVRGESHGPSSWLSITLTEGKNRQVRKMTAAVGFPTLRLVRVRIGQIALESMKSGEVTEVQSLLVDKKIA